MITTRNRVRELQRTLAKVRSLAPAPVEILVTADGCSDGTPDLVKQGFPDVALRINERALGSVGSRDQMMRVAQGELVLALDDDSYPEQSDCLARFGPLFRERLNLAVAHFPQRTDEYPETLRQNSFGPPCLTGSFANSGAVLRRSAYIALGGFEPWFFHMYEEPDFALRCVSAGWEILRTPVVTIRHHFTPTNRESIRSHQLHARNEFWSTLMRCPQPMALAVCAYRCLSQLRFAARTRGLAGIIREPQWWFAALGGVAYAWRHRDPVPWSSYQRWRRLTARAMRLQDPRAVIEPAAVD